MKLNFRLMRKYFYFTIGILLISFSFNSCKEDVELVGEFKETAVIYGLLDQSESTHFIKINRAFIGPGNALEIAKIPDSSYFSSVNATITEYLNNYKTGKSWILKDTVINTKNTNGVFYAPTEKLYYFDDTSLGGLNPNAIYKLEIIIYKGTNKEFIVSGETGLVNGITSGQSSQNAAFDFINNSDGKLKATNVSVSNTGNASVINASIKIEFDEYQNSTIVNPVSIIWNTGESEVQSNSTFSTSIEGQIFYDLIKTNTTSNPIITKRKLKSMTIILTGGSEEFNNYINTNKPSTSLAQTKPNYTNLKISNDNYVIGIFSSRQTVSIVKPFSISLQNSSCLSQKSRQELCEGVTTYGLLFCSDNNFDANKSFYCN